MDSDRDPVENYQLELPYKPSSVSVYWKKITVPKGLPALLETFVREAIRENPEDIYTFLADLTESLLAKRANEQRAKSGKESKDAEQDVYLPSNKQADQGTSAEEILPAECEQDDNTKGPEADAVTSANDEDIASQFTGDESEQAAATKLQSSFRGFKARKALREQPESNTAEASDTLPLNNDEEKPLTQEFEEAIQALSNEKSNENVKEPTEKMAENKTNDVSEENEISNEMETLAEEGQMSIDPVLENNEVDVETENQNPVEVQSEDDNTSEKVILENETLPAKERTEKSPTPEIPSPPAAVTPEPQENEVNDDEIAAEIKTPLETIREESFDQSSISQALPKTVEEQSEKPIDLNNDDENENPAGECEEQVDEVEVTSKTSVSKSGSAKLINEDGHNVHVISSEDVDAALGDLLNGDTDDEQEPEDEVEDDQIKLEKSVEDGDGNAVELVAINSGTIIENNPIDGGVEVTEEKTEIDSSNKDEKETEKEEVPNSSRQEDDTVKVIEPVIQEVNDVLDVPNEEIGEDNAEANDGKEVKDELVEPVDDAKQASDIEIEANENVPENEAGQTNNNIPTSPVPTAPPEEDVNLEVQEEPTAEKSEPLQLQGSNASAITGDSSGDREDTDIATPTEYSIQEEKDSLNSEDLKKFASNFGNEAVPESDVAEISAAGEEDIRPEDMEEEKVSTSEPTESSSPQPELLQIEMKPSNEAESGVVDAPENLIEVQPETTEGDEIVINEENAVELKPETDVVDDVKVAEETLSLEDQLPEPASSPEPIFPVLKPDTQIEASTEDAQPPSITPTTEIESSVVVATIEQETSTGSKEIEMGESESDQTQVETVIAVSSEINPEVEVIADEIQEVEAASSTDNIEKNENQLEKIESSVEQDGLSESQHQETGSPEEQMEDHANEKEASHVSNQETPANPPQEEQVAEDLGLNDSTVLEEQSPVTPDIPQADSEKADLSPDTDTTQNVNSDETENPPPTLPSEPAQINNDAENDTPFTSNETNGGGQVDEALPNAIPTNSGEESDKTAENPNSGKNVEENSSGSWKPTVRPRLKQARSVANEPISMNEPEENSSRSDSPVLRRPRSGPSRSKMATTRYRSGFVLDNQVSMEEMEKVIENEMLSKAAMKIQAGFRGFKTRKDLHSKYGDLVSKRSHSVAESLEKAIITDAALCDEMSASKNASVEKARSAESDVNEKDEQGQLSDKLPILHNSSQSFAAPHDDEMIDLNDPEILDAATKIQANFRGFKVRKSLKRRPSELQIDQEKSISGFQKFSKSLDLNSAEETENDSKESDKAATTIQAKFRSYKERQAFSEKKKAIILIQATVRGYLTRKRLERAKRLRSPQASLAEDVDNLEKLHDAATKIQAIYRGFRVRSKISQRSPNV